MDWSSIYDESGDEDGDWTGFSSRLTPILENFSSRGKYTATICYIFTINYILGGYRECKVCILKLQVVPCAYLMSRECCYVFFNQLMDG